MDALAYYRRKFIKLKRGNVAGVSEKAPHKPVLLLAVLAEIEAGSIIGNRIYITPELVARFRDVWSRVVRNPSFKPDFFLPFYHLKGEGFWHLQLLPGREFLLTASHSPKSFRSLRETVNYAFLDDALFALTQDAIDCEVLCATLLEAYFGDSGEAGNSYIQTVETQILTEAPAQYRQAAIAFDEEEIVARGGVFKRVVPRVYDYTCAVSGMRIFAGASVQVEDACHIVPFAESRDDTIANGLSLCPNLHRAFDRGLIRIDADYRVAISPIVTEREGVYGLREFAGRKIMLPKEEGWRPGRENLEKHWLMWAENF
jgi:putative restriction endonuclease